jgi:hypothetical protein
LAEIPLRVQCNLTEPDLSPVRFQVDNRDLFVEEILDHWWGKDATYFKVRADDDRLYILKHKTTQNLWTLDSLARSK